MRSDVRVGLKKRIKANPEEGMNLKDKGLGTDLPSK